MRDSSTKCPFPFFVLCLNIQKKANMLRERDLKCSSFRSSYPEVFVGKGVLKLCSKFTGEHPCRSAISIKLQSNFIEIALRHECSPVNLLHIFKTPFLKNTSEWLPLKFTEILYSASLYYLYFVDGHKQKVLIVETYMKTELP